MKVFFCGVPMLPVNGQPFLLRACVLTSIGHIMAYIYIIYSLTCNLAFLGNETDTRFESV